MKKAKDFEKEVEIIRIRVIETIKLKITNLFKNHNDLANEICFAELDSCGSNPIYQPVNVETDFATCFDDIRVEGNILYFTYSSVVQDLSEGNESQLSLQNAIDILSEIENLTEDDLNFD